MHQNLTARVQAYFAELRQNQIVSTSHFTLQSMYRDFRMDAVDAEIARYVKENF